MQKFVSGERNDHLGAPKQDNRAAFLMSTARLPRWLLLSICLMGSPHLAAAGPQQPTEVSSIADLVSASDPGHGLSVRLKGVVTYYDHDRRLLFLQEADDGAMVRFIP